MFICCECCVLSGRGLCDELITRPEESFGLWCVVVCDLENLKNEDAMTSAGSQHPTNIKDTRFSEGYRGQDLSLDDNMVTSPRDISKYF
jgi:hypothetical protein